MQKQTKNEYAVDLKDVQDAFNQAAAQYDEVAFLQRTITDRSMEAFEHLKLSAESILDLGAGTGYGARALRAHFKKARITQLDVSNEMLKMSRNQSPRRPGNHERQRP